MKEMHGRRKERGRSGRGSRRRIAVFGSLAVCLIALTALLLTPIFNITEVYCEGNDKVLAEDILAAANVEIGRNIFGIKPGQISRNVKAIPFVEESSVRRVFPNKIKISVTECVPVSYVYTNDKCYMIDESGMVLRIIDDKASVDALIISEEREKYADLAKKSKDNKDKENDKTDAESTAEPTDEADEEADEDEDTAEDEDEDGGESADKEEQTDEDGTEPTSEPTEIPSEGEILKSKYNIPVVLGLEYKQAEEKRMPKSGNEDRYRKTLELLKDMKDAGLLFRATLVDVRNASDIRIWIEDRLEIMLSGFDNLSYKTKFLAKIINEGISAYEHAVVDFRGDDVYVRPHDDGEERVKIKKQSLDEDETNSEENISEEKKNTDEPEEDSDETEDDAETKKTVTSLEDEDDRQKTGQNEISEDEEE